MACRWLQGAFRRCLKLIEVRLYAQKLSSEAVQAHKTTLISVVYSMLVISSGKIKDAPQRVRTTHRDLKTTTYVLGKI